MNTENKDVQSTVVVVKEESKISKMVRLLSEEIGYTKKQLVELTQLKDSTVNCQIYFHLPKKGFQIQKDGLKYRIIGKGEPKVTVKKEQEVVITEC